MEELRDRDLLALSDEDFVAVWKALLGEPPAALVARSDMVELLLQSLPPDRTRLEPDEEARNAA
jgi:hypothetical protein